MCNIWLQVIFLNRWLACKNANSSELYQEFTLCLKIGVVLWNCALCKPEEALAMANLWLHFAIC